MGGSWEEWRPAVEGDDTNTESDEPPKDSIPEELLLLVEVRLKTNQNLTASYSSFSLLLFSTPWVFVCEIIFPSLVSVRIYSYKEAHKNHGFACSCSHCPALTFHCCYRQHKQVVGWDGMGVISIDWLVGRREKLGGALEWFSDAGNEKLMSNKHIQQRRVPTTRKWDKIMLTNN